MRVKKLLHTRMRVSDMDQTIRFYTDVLGLEVMEQCLPLASAGVVMGYLVATYSLQDLLDDLARQLTRSHEVSFTEGDGTRLAIRGTARRSSRVFSAQQLLDLERAASRFTRLPESSCVLMTIAATTSFPPRTSGPTK